jgi:hypothetical protein
VLHARGVLPLAPAFCPVPLARRLMSLPPAMRAGRRNARTAAATAGG